MQHRNDVLLEGTSHAWIYDLDHLLEDLRDFHVITENAHDYAHERIQNLWILNPVEQSLPQKHSTLQTKLMASLTPRLFLLKLSMIFSKYWSISIFSL